MGIQYEVKEESDNFDLYLTNSKVVVKDLYGTDGSKTRLMLDKLESCTTIPQINNVLAWGRNNLL